MAVSTLLVILSSICKPNHNFINTPEFYLNLILIFKFKLRSAHAFTFPLRVAYLCDVFPCDLFAGRELLPHAPDHRCEHLQQGPNLDDAILWDGNLLVRVGLIPTAIGQVLKQTNKSGFITDVTDKSVVLFKEKRRMATKNA